MNLYHIWANLEPGASDVAFAEAVAAFCERLEGEGMIAGWRLTRRKLGLGPERLPEWHIVLEFETLAELDEAFTRVAARSDPLEAFHHAVNAPVRDVLFALYRDFPDPVRQRGEERF